MVARPTKPLVVVVGETASGKSALAMSLARKFKGEIIAADSLTVRRGVNVGTAKPSAADQAEIPHHLIDIVEPCADFTAAVFKDLAIKATAEIAERGNLPIMVGGTGLYVDGVLFDYSFMPAGDRVARIELNKLSNNELINRIHAAGFDLDGIDTRNKRRLIRLLETGGQKPGHGELREQTLVVGLRVSRTQLRKNIEQRVETMFRRGLRREVEQLVAKYSWDCEALKAIGYIEWQKNFSGQQSLNKTKAAIVKATLNLAKRQRTWFKRNPHIQWVSEPVEAEALVDKFLRYTKQ
jgi:tRNA dimethylallyltransferase